MIQPNKDCIQVKKKIKLFFQSNIIMTKILSKGSSSQALSEEKNLITILFYQHLLGL